MVKVQPLWNKQYDFCFYHNTLLISELICELEKFINKIIDLSVLKVGRHNGSQFNKVTRED